MNKKAQITDWITTELGMLVLAILSAGLILAVFFTVTGIFSTPRPRDNAYLDLDRIVSEITGLRQGESIRVIQKQGTSYKKKHPGSP